jgi:hypothetical protein
MQDTKLATIHDINGTDAVTTTEARVIEELIMQGGLKPIITFMNILKAMSVARQIGDDAGYKEVSKGYKEAFNEAVDMLNTKQGTIAAKAEPPKAQRTDAKKCENCGHLVLWLKGSEKSVPVFAENVGMKETVFNPDVHKTHYFNDCKRVKGANKFKRPDGVTTDEQAQLF